GDAPERRRSIDPRRGDPLRIGREPTEREVMARIESADAFALCVPERHARAAGREDAVALRVNRRHAPMVEPGLGRSELDEAALSLDRANLGEAARVRHHRELPLAEERASHGLLLI